VKVILGKCKGGGVEIIDFFSIDCERLMILYIPSREDFKLTNLFCFVL
jgi:hypothetical protein